MRKYQKHIVILIISVLIGGFVAVHAGQDQNFDLLNYHYVKKTSNAEKQKYLLQQIRAVEDAKGVSGWYVWRANNVYDNLFMVLKNNKIRSADSTEIKTAQK